MFTSVAALNVYDTGGSIVTAGIEIYPDPLLTTLKSSRVVAASTASHTAFEPMSVKVRVPDGNDVAPAVRVIVVPLTDATF